MTYVIGLDFGNFNSFPCFIEDFDESARLGGKVHDLLPEKDKYGIPSVFFYSKKLGELYGGNAVMKRARPEANRVRYLKKTLEGSKTLDDRDIEYGEMITKVVQHCVRTANAELYAGWQVTTNLVSLSYPATYTFAKRQRLIDLVEKGTLEDGRAIKVCGTIAEPAAAALDFLVESACNVENAAVLAYDLGGGTFDLALVSVYPKGKTNGDGVRFYDIVDTGGCSDVGGKDFDEALFELLKSKFEVPLKPLHEAELRGKAEGVKMELTISDSSCADLLYGEEYLEVEVTRDEFETASRELLMKTIAETKKMLAEHPNQQPDYIVLTGGASRMPMVQKEVERAFPQFAGRIGCYKPGTAIASGAARYGTLEENPNPSMGVGKRLEHDLGVRYWKSGSDASFVETYLRAGTPIPCESEWIPSETRMDGQDASVFRVYEANKQNPSEYRVDEDFVEIMQVELKYGRKVPKGTESMSKLVVDDLSLLTIEVRKDDVPGIAPVSQSIELKNVVSE